MERLGEPISEAAPPPVTPPPASPEPSDRVIGGVAGTIAARLGIDPLWVRLGFVVLGLAGGIGVVVYAAWWLVLVGGAWSPPLRYAGGAVLIGGVPLLLTGGSRSFVTGPPAVVLLLAGLALALWQPRRAAAPSVAPSPPPAPWSGPSGTPSPAPTAPSGATASGRDALAPAADGEWHVLADGMVVEPPPTPTPPARPARTRREPSLLGRLTLGAAIWVGAAWALADQIDGGRLHPEQWLGAGAIICGAGLLVGTFRGRARWLIIPAVLAAGGGYVAGTMARLGITVGDFGGDHYVSVGSYTSSTEIDERIGLGEVQVTVDSPPPQPVHVDARVAVGRIQLHVAPDVTVELRPRLDHGSVTTASGLAISETSPTLIGDGATADVIVDAWVGRGDIDVVVFNAPVVYAGDPGVPTTLAPERPLVPAESGALVPIRDGIDMTSDGWVVIGYGEAVISPDDQVTSIGGGQYPEDGQYPDDGGHDSEADGTETISTSWGQYRLLPRSLLLTPDGQVLDLQALRAEVANAAPTTTATPAPTAPPAVTAPPTATTLTVPPAPPTTVTSITVPASTLPGG